jgi:hypothetical protein
MKEAEFIGKVNRFGSEYSVYLNPADNQIRITDDRGNELKCDTKNTKGPEDILERVPIILQKIGL